MKKIICSLFLTTQVNTALTNLSEAGFAEHAVSVKASTPKAAEVYAPDTGLFKGMLFSDVLTSLGKKGLPQATASLYQQGIQKGMLLVIVTTSEKLASVAAEILSDSGGTTVTEV